MCFALRGAATLLLALSLLLALPSLALAQDAVPGFQVEQFEPLPAQGANILSTGKSDVLPHFKPTAGLFLHFVDDPLQVVNRQQQDAILGRLVDDQFKAEIALGIGLYDFIDLSLVLPTVLYQSGDLSALGSLPDLNTVALQDMRLIPKLRIVNPEWAAGFGAALMVPIYLPTGDTESFNSDGTVRAEPRLIIDYRHPVGLAVAGNIGLQFRPTSQLQNFVSGNTLRWAVAAELPTGLDYFQILFNLFGSAQVSDQVDQAGNIVVDTRDKPVELQGGVQFKLPFNLVLNAGAGGGLTNGIGSPDFRVFTSISYTPLVGDRDNDTYPDDEDGCPDKPEDFDDFEDADGCPDPDNDKDGILDVDDQCKNDPEDKDDFEDEDGCPDPDNDKDGILDEPDECPNVPGPKENKGCPINDRDGDKIVDDEDKCPDDPEDYDEFEDTDGCPDPDNDQDGILDKPDQCPMEPEDKDGFEDEDGCPDPDNDKDGIPDTKDKCPNKPETINGVKDTDGCPDKGKSKVRITRTKIEILEKVYFDKGKAKIKSRSFNLLNQVASIIKANPQITKLRVEGHTDERGKDDYNLDLSERRAASVKNYLERQGVPAAKIISKGYGENQPVEDCSQYRRRRKKKTCWAKNRRVEFTILEVNGKPVGSEGAIIEKKEVIDKK